MVNRPWVQLCLVILLILALFGGAALVSHCATREAVATDRSIKLGISDYPGSVWPYVDPLTKRRFLIFKSGYGMTAVEVNP